MPALSGYSILWGGGGVPALPPRAAGLFLAAVGANSVRGCLWLPPPPAQVPATVPAFIRISLSVVSGDPDLYINIDASQ